MIEKSLRDFHSECNFNSSYSEDHIPQSATLKPNQRKHLLRATNGTNLDTLRQLFWHGKADHITQNRDVQSEKLRKIFIAVL